MRCASSKHTLSSLSEFVDFKGDAALPPPSSPSLLHSSFLIKSATSLATRDSLPFCSTKCVTISAGSESKHRRSTCKLDSTVMRT
jgi:hypothetical protein